MSKPLHRQRVHQLGTWLELGKKEIPPDDRNHYREDKKLKVELVDEYF